MLNEQIEVVTGMLLDLDEDLHEIHDILEVDEKWILDEWLHQTKLRLIQYCRLNNINLSKENTMAWTKPMISEISVGLEINSYACAEK